MLPGFPGTESFRCCFGQEARLLLDPAVVTPAPVCWGGHRVQGWPGLWCLIVAGLPMEGRCQQLETCAYFFKEGLMQGHSRAGGLPLPLPLLDLEPSILGVPICPPLRPQFYIHW